MEPSAKQPEREANPPPESSPAGRRPFRVFSFPGSGFDTVLQMGVVHALLVTRRRAPEMVAGMSVGAITAAVFGDILHTGADSTASETEIEESRVARFNELLEAFRNAPNTVLKGFFPDALETNSAHALKPVELPRHFQEERESRQAAVASRTGLIRLFDHLLRVRVSVKLVAQLLRVLMGWNAAAEMPAVGRLGIRVGLLIRLWGLIARNIVALSLPVSLVARVQLREVLGITGRKRPIGVEAGHIIFNRGAWLRKAGDFAQLVVLGFLPLLVGLAAVPALVLNIITAENWFAHLAQGPGWLTSLVFLASALSVAGMAAWGSLFFRKNAFTNLLRHFQIFSDLGDSHALRDALVQNLDPSYYGEFCFDDSVRRALKHQMPAHGGTRSRRSLLSYSQCGKDGAIVVSIAANLGTGKLEALPPTTPVVDALMCACASAPFFKAQTINTPGGSATFIDGISVSNDPIVPVFEEACRMVTAQPGKGWTSLRIISVPLLPIRQDKSSAAFEPYTGLVDTTLRALDLQRFQDMLLDKGLIDRLSRALNGRSATISRGTSRVETILPAKIRLVAPERRPHLSFRLMRAGSAAKQRDLIDSAVADGCRAMIERLVTDAMPDTRTPEERRMLLEPDEEIPDEWPHRDEGRTARLRDAVEALRMGNQTITRDDGREYVSCRKLLAAWGGLGPLPGSTPVDRTHPMPGPGVSEVCRCCVACRAGENPADSELRQHVRLPRTTRSPFVSLPPPAETKKDPAVVFLFSGGVFRGVFQVGFSNAVSELGIQPDVVAGSSVGTIVGALTGRVFQRPAGVDLLERQRQMRRLAATFLTIDRFVLTDRFADFIRHFSIHAAAADFSPRDLDLIFRRYETDLSSAFSRRARRVFSGLERLFFLNPFEVMELTKTLRAGNMQEAFRLVKLVAQEVVDRYGVGLEILGPEPLEQLIDGFVFDGRPVPEARFDHFGFPLIGTTTNLTLGQLEILRSTHPGDPRFTQSLLAGSAFPALFRPRWSWEVYRNPESVAQYADGGIMDNLPLGAVVEYLWGKDGNAVFPRRPDIPHLILTATLETDKADWTQRDDLDELSWTDIRARSSQLRYNGKIGKFQQGQRDIRRIIQQRILEGDPDAHSHDLPLNLDVLAVKPAWVCGFFAFHPMLGFSRKNQTESIAHGCASTICAVAEHFRTDNQTHAVDTRALRDWARSRGIRLDQLPERKDPLAEGARAFGPASLSGEEQAQGACWFRVPDEKTGRRPVCPFHSASPSSTDGEEVAPELEKIYHACGKCATHEARPT